MTDTFPALDDTSFRLTDMGSLFPAQRSSHAPRILLMYGSLRDRSFSRFMAEEAARVLRRLGCETRIFDPRGLPQVDDAEADHPKVAELREAVMWSEGMVWSSPERHGAMTSIMKQQVDWIPLAPIGGVRPRRARRWP